MTPGYMSFHVRIKALQSNPRYDASLPPGWPRPILLSASADERKRAWIEVRIDVKWPQTATLGELLEIA